MAEYKNFSYDQTRLLPVSFNKQIQPGSFEYTLSYLIDNRVDLSCFKELFRNDETGAPAYDPAILLKIILFAYSRGIEEAAGPNKSLERNSRRPRHASMPDRRYFAQLAVIPPMRSTVKHGRNGTDFAAD